MNPPKPNPRDDSDTTWRERFCWASFFGAAPTFMWLYFTNGGFVEAIGTAALVGTIFGFLAAVFGKRMLEFLMRIPW